MKKNILLPLTISLFFMTPAAAIFAKKPPAKEPHCESGGNFYARILSGANFLQNSTTDGNKASYETGYIIDGSLGYSWRTYGLRLEGEYAFRRNGIKKIDFITQGSSNNGHFQTSSYMVNLLWDFPLCSWGCKFWKIYPFIGAGLGYDAQQMHASNSLIVFNQKWHHFSWQVMTGLAYSISRNIGIDLEYKFHQGGTQFCNHSIGLGLVYKFGFSK